jgi:hypothetical protein
MKSYGKTSRHSNERWQLASLSRHPQAPPLQARISRAPAKDAPGGKE